jgi:selenocysteine lyase/cysteine desulfurase
LRARLQRGLEAIPGVEVVTPASEALCTAMVSFHVEGVESAALQKHLADTANVRTRVVGEYGYGWMRLSTHVYNRPAEVDRALELISAVARDGLGRGG